MAQPAILALDQGTTSSRAIAFDAAGRPVADARQALPQHYPADGWVEHDPEDIWDSTLATARAALTQATAAGYEIVAIGITNQRETTLLWDRASGAPLHKAIVWQDRRTAGRCAALKAAGHEAMVTAKTGLVLDPYFSATKLAWLLDRDDDLRQRARSGSLAFGTVDSFLMWRLTGGARHATDATNAARTLLYNIHDNRWDQELCALFGVPRACLPEVLDCAAPFGETDPALFGRAIPIAGVAGDQQAAAIGQACFRPGAVKSTYGTGCFLILNTGETPVVSRNRLLTTICYRFGGRTTYAIEGSIFNAGTTIQWLRDGLRVIDTAADSEALARGLDGNQDVYLVPAFTGLGAPYWEPAARGALSGLTRDTGPAVLARAALECVGYQTHDLFRAMAEDGVAPTTLRVDGGMVANDWMVQFLADVLAVPVDRPQVTETTALGAACCAGLQVGLFSGLDALAGQWQVERRFEPAMAALTRERLLTGWRQAVARVLPDRSRGKPAS